MLVISYVTRSRSYCCMHINGNISRRKRHIIFSVNHCNVMCHLSCLRAITVYVCTRFLSFWPLLHYIIIVKIVQSFCFSYNKVVQRKCTFEDAVRSWLPSWFSLNSDKPSLGSEVYPKCFDVTGCANGGRRWCFAFAWLWRDLSTLICSRMGGMFAEVTGSSILEGWKF